MIDTHDDLTTSGNWADEATFEVKSPFILALREQLFSEAIGLRQSSRVFAQEDAIINRDGSMTTRSEFGFHPGGPVLDGLLRNVELMRAARRATGLRRLVPVKSGYNYYSRGSHLGLHRDGIRATVTMVIGLTDNLPSMNWAPALRYTTNDRLVALTKAAGIHPLGHELLPVPTQHLRGFDGYNVPHWRPPFTEELGILATFSYFDL